ncbi:MAG: DUF1800 domain-containing protein [Acidobacteriota bacterium]|nr:DUF1800 domain-containing protein [Acidobacteriota bacterium]
MKGLLSGLFTISFLLTAATADNPFQTRLSSDQRILHALNRLTFGPRPAELDEVRRAGVEKWIELQLHPERIAENPVLVGLIVGGLPQPQPVLPQALEQLLRRPAVLEEATAAAGFVDGQQIGVFKHSNRRVAQTRMSAPTGPGVPK